MNIAVIFDMDGVLIDTTNIIWRTNNMLMASYGIKFTPQEISEYSGMSLKDQIAEWNRKYRLSIDYKQYKAKSLKNQLELIKKEITCNPWLITFLDELKKNHVPIGVGTSSSRKRAEIFLKHLGISNYFSTVVTMNECHKHKPNPDIFLMTAENLGVQPNNCVVIEDAINGIEAAKRAGMKSIGLVNKYASREQLAGANIIITGFEDMTYNQINSLFPQ